MQKLLVLSLFVEVDVNFNENTVDVNFNENNVDVNFNEYKNHFRFVKFFIKNHVNIFLEIKAR